MRNFIDKDTIRKYRPVSVRIDFAITYRSGREWKKAAVRKYSYIKISVSFKKVASDVDIFCEFKKLHLMLTFFELYDILIQYENKEEYPLSP